MSERRFQLGIQSGCVTGDAIGVMVKGEDARWRYWLEVGARLIPGSGEFLPTRAGHARLKACAQLQLERLVWPPRRNSAWEDVQ